MAAELPTRLSLADDGAECTKYDVFLDGVKQTRCTVADAAQGYVVRYRHNAFGLPVVRNNQRVTETVRGEVVIARKMT